jgi:Fe-S cluster assembly protein SufB
LNEVEVQRTKVYNADNDAAGIICQALSDGSFCYIPKGVRSPMELSTYFRINAESSG